jgi:16S rRNA (guanine(966)-N(2))-methyltransferase RsmD
MRVIAGVFKGRRLISPKGTDVRPTADRVKEAIFSMIQHEISGSVCLDLFAGSGAMGIEAISRGALRVYFCDINAASIAAILQNIDICGAADSRAVLIKSDWHGLGRFIKEKCNLVFIDAPYDMRVYYSQILEALARQGIIGDEACIVVERDSRAGGYEFPAGFEAIKEKRYGSTGVDLLLYREADLLLNRKDESDNE